MTASNGKRDPNEVKDRLGKLKAGGGISPETAEFLQRRTEAFQNATSGRGQPLTYGALKKDRKP